MDVALVVVHGIGEQLRGATLTTWAEPVLARLDRLSRSRGGTGAVVLRSDLTEEKPAEVRIRVSAGAAGFRTVSISEARWARSFLSPPAAEVLPWVRRFAWTALGRAGRHLLRVGSAAIEATRSVTDAGVGMARAELSAASPRRGVGLVPALVLVLTALAAAAMLALVVAAGVVLLPVALAVGLLALTGVAVAARLPVLGPRVRPLMVAMTSVIGDANVWTTRPVSAAAMRDVVRDEIARVEPSAASVVVMGHSQGAAVAYSAVLEDGGRPVDCLVTVGGAVSLLGRPSAGRGGDRFAPVARWAPELGLRWVDVWALWDPVPSGPVADDPRAARSRWHECLARGRYRDVLLESAADAPGDDDDRPLPWWLGWLVPMAAPADHPSPVGRALEPEQPQPDDEDDEDDEDDVVGEGAIGPEELPVHNRSSLIGDHTTYAGNLVQVVDPLCRLLLDPGVAFADSRATAEDPEAVARLRLEKRAATAVRELGWMRVLAALLAVSSAPVLFRQIEAWGWVDRLSGGLNAADGGWRDVVAGVLDGEWRVALGTAVTATLAFVVLISLAGAVWRPYYAELAWSTTSVRFRTWQLATRLTGLAVAAAFVWRGAVMLGVDPFSLGWVVAVVALCAPPYLGALPAPAPARRATGPAPDESGAVAPS